MKSFYSLAALVSTSLAASLPRDTAAGACVDGTTYTVNGRTCTAQCNFDYSGGDKGALYTGNFVDCANACTSDNQCVTAQYNQGNGYCYLKDRQNSGSSSGNTDSIVCPSSSTSPGTTPVAPACAASSSTYASGRTCTTSCGKDRAGGDYASVHTDSLTACMDLCGQDANCVTAQYHKDTSYCYLKNSANQLDDSTTTDTIDCKPPRTFYIKASSVTPNPGSGPQRNFLPKSQGLFAQLVTYRDQYGYTNQALTFLAQDTTTAAPFYIDGLGRLTSQDNGWVPLAISNIRASPLYWDPPQSTFSGYDWPKCSVDPDTNVLSCSLTGMTGMSICFGGSQSISPTKAPYGTGYMTKLPSTQGNDCRAIVPTVVYA